MIKLKLIVCLVIFEILVLGCTHVICSLPQTEFSIRLQGNEGRQEVVDYVVQSVTKIYEEGQLVRRKEEGVTFRVENLYKSAPKGQVLVESRVTEKDGVMDLHEMAFPELEETIEFAYSSDGQVLKAGLYPKESVFYVPSLPFPKEMVKEGGTWEDQFQWVGLKNGIPAQMSVVGIFKGVTSCGDLGPCGWIDLSGQVEILGPKGPQKNFQSEIRGKILWSFKKGLVLWSMMKGNERLVNRKGWAEVQSCVLSKIIKPKTEAQLVNLPLKCNPNYEEKIPTPSATM